MLLQPDAGMVGEKPGWLAKSQWPSCGYLRARRSVRTARSISAAPATPLRRPSGSRYPPRGCPLLPESSPTPEAGPPTACPLTFAAWAVVPAPVLSVLAEAGAFWLAPVDCAASL